MCAAKEGTSISALASPAVGPSAENFRTSSASQVRESKLVLRSLPQTIEKDGVRLNVTRQLVISVASKAKPTASRVVEHQKVKCEDLDLRI